MEIQADSNINTSRQQYKRCDSRYVQGNAPTDSNIRDVTLEMYRVMPLNRQQHHGNTSRQQYKRCDSRNVQGNAPK